MSEEGFWMGWCHCEAPEAATRSRGEIWERDCVFPTGAGQRRPGRLLQGCGRLRSDLPHRKPGLVRAAVGILVVLLCFSHLHASEGYLLQASLTWERIGATPQYYSKGGVYANLPCGRNTPAYEGNPACGNPQQGIEDTTLYPKPHLVHIVLNLVVDCGFWRNLGRTVSECPEPATGGETGRDQDPLLFGTFCLDTSLPSDTPDNCATPGFKIMHIDTTSSPKRVYLQWVQVWDYKGELSRNLYDPAPPPLNVTVGFNWTGIGDQQPWYQSCAFDGQAGNLAQPPCFCQTVECGIAAEEGLNHWGAWTVETVIPFSLSSTRFVDNITPATNHHSPRLYFPPIVSVPMLFKGENLTHPIGAVDEDGTTRLSFSFDPRRAVVTVTEDGHMVFEPLAERGISSGEPLQADYRRYLYRSHVTAVDPVNPDPKVTSQLLFWVQTCFKQTPGAIQHHPWGISALRLGSSPATFANVGPARCMVNGTEVEAAGALDAAACIAAGYEWHAAWLTAPSRRVFCALHEPCRVAVTAVKLNFTDEIACRWSDQPGRPEPLCGNRLQAGAAIDIDGKPATVTGEHTLSAVTGSNPATITLQPFEGRRANTYSAPNPYEFDIGRQEVFCLLATFQTDFQCPSLPHCVTVEVKGTVPELISPSNSPTCPVRSRDDFLQYVGLNSSLCPDLFACWRATTGSEVTLKAHDPDEGETVNIVVDSISSLNDYAAELLVESALAFPDATGADAETYCDARTVDPYALFMEVTKFVTPRSATKDCRTGLRKVTFDLDYAAAGRSPITTNVTALGGRYALIGEDKMLCYTVSDNQARVWGRGVSNSYGKCHIIRMRGAPVFVRNPDTPLDTPFAGADANGLGVGEVTLTARLAEEVNFTFRARDPDEEDEVQILLLEDPGLPNEAALEPQVCLPQPDLTNVNAELIPRKRTLCPDGVGGEQLCPTVGAPCQEASRFFHWTPTPGSEGETYKVCAVAKDQDGSCGLYHKRRNAACDPDPTVACGIDGTDGASDRSTTHGYYGAEHCVAIYVTAPSPAWDVGTVPSVAGTNKLAHVGCEVRWKVSATDANAYPMHLQVSEDTPLPAGARMVTLQSGVTAHQEMVWTPVRGMEGSTYTVCFQAWSLVGYPSQLHSGPMQFQRLRNTDGSTELPRRCVHVKVRRCKYCVTSEETLLVKMKEYSVDMNWLRLWAANGNDDGDDLTTPVEDPGVLGSGALDGVHNGQLLNIGPVYKFQPGDSLMSIAGRFRTTLKSLLDLNPDITDPAVVRTGQEVCLIPCSA